MFINDDTVNIKPENHIYTLDMVLKPHSSQVYIFTTLHNLSSGISI